MDRRAADDVHPEPSVITVEPDRLRYDIEIPQLSRVLHRSATELVSLRPEDVPARAIPLAEEMRSETVDYTGRDLRTREIVERAEYEFPTADEPGPVVAWFADTLARETRVVGQFALLAALVKGYLERRAFGGPVDVGDPLVLQALREPAARETVLQVLATPSTSALSPQGRLPRNRSRCCCRAQGRSCGVGRPSPRRGRCSRRSRATAVWRCASAGSSTDATTSTPLPSSLVKSGSRWSTAGNAVGSPYYYPDFALRLTSGECMIVETKGRVDVDVPRKDERASRWADDASASSGVRWSYLRVDEELFERHAGELRAMHQLVELVELVYEARREDYLRSLPTPRRRTPEEIVSMMNAISE